MVVAGGGGEGEAADAAGEGAVVAAAAAGVGERLVGLLHLDEAARVLPGGARRRHVRVVLARHPPVCRPHVLEARPLRRDPQQLVERRLLLLLLRRPHALPSRGCPRAQQRPRRRPGGGAPERATGGGGEGSSGEVGHLGLDVSTNCCCSALIWSEAKSGAGFLCFFEMERKPSIQALDPACVEKICVESFSCPPLVAFIVLLLLLFLFPGFYYFIYFRIALAAQFILFYFSSSFLPQRSHAHVWL